MRKKICFFPLFLVGICLAFISCLDNDDDEEDIDKEWKTLNENRYYQLQNDPSYNALSSQTGNGAVYWKYSTVITDSDNPLKITAAGKPEFTDTVVVRYEGWYLNKDGEKIIFDSTENPSLKSQIDYSLGNSPTPYPNKGTAKFAVNPQTVASASNGYISGPIEGWSTVLQDMVLNDEREVCIPYELGYGGSIAPYQPSSSTVYTLIPAYTTLWFRLKVMKIIPMAGRS